ncbi:thiamine diphosphokinase [Aspergillus ibericus CBS 121593]|uniref:Thiamine pyrophosphokinase n=1 Tax=Aspergillus ibericus CBS 121593 TaxID=1448316 RepID=A0A395GI53_9EURO|nr:thiamine pyrophosphokinase [Aspergillus ibericus CBS 121593]RAK94932.1 thiamine pyrophosphokinase [Aspergillus ibericus CBS 121593]
MEWDPTQFFRGDSDSPPAPFALLILNHPINEKAYDVLQKHAMITVCVDGGANHFYEMMKAKGRENSHIKHPNIIIGDLDSIRPAVRTHYESHGVNVIYHHDEYCTDFTKALRYIRAHVDEILPSTSTTTTTTTTAITNETQHPPKNDNEKGNDLTILILGGLGGRVDQAFSQIHHLYSHSTDTTPESTQTRNKTGHLYLISEESITFILHPGRNIIRTPRARCIPSPSTPTPTPTPTTSKNTKQTAEEKEKEEEEEEEEGTYLLEENVGMIPLHGIERITTKGFQWDVEEWETVMGGQLSTSNHIRAEEVEVRCGGALLMTLELAGRFKRVI